MPRRWRSGPAALARGELALDDAARIDLIRALEELKCAAEGAQAQVAAEFESSQRAVAEQRGVPAERRGRGIAEQIALARRESPHRGRRHLRLARVLHEEMTCTAAALRAGRITEYKASLLAHETSCLSREDRIIVDATISGDPARVEEMGDRQAAAQARKLAAELDVEAVAERRRRAESERHVSVRPAPDTMTWLGALLPVKDGIAVFAALKAAADTARASGDPRSRGQVMADTLCQRVTGAAGDVTAPTDGRGTSTPVSLGVVMTDGALFAGCDDPAHLEGYGPIPADLARELVAHAISAGDRVWLRRLYTHPGTGELVAMDSRQRLFRDGLAALIRLRDQTCRTPWCDAPIRRGDHAVEHQSRGPTSLENGQGLCEACDLAKQAPGWRASPVADTVGHQIDTTTPTGHRYRSRAPALTRPPYRLTQPGVWTLVA